MPEFENTDITDVEYKEHTDPTYVDAEALYVDGSGIWTRSSTATPVAVYNKGGVVFSSEFAASAHFSITVPGTYHFTCYGAGGGSAMAAWSNVPGTYGGAAVAPGGGGAYVKVAAYLQAGDIIDISVGTVGLSRSRTLKGSNGPYSIQGGTGGATYVNLTRNIPATRVRSYTGRRWQYITIPAQTISTYIAYAAGGKGGFLSLNTASTGNSVTNKIVTPGAGGIPTVASSNYSSSLGYWSGPAGTGSIEVDEDYDSLTNIQVNGKVSGSGYGIGSAGRASKLSSMSGVTLTCEDAFTTANGYRTVDPNQDGKLRLVGADGYILVTYQSNYLRSKYSRWGNRLF